MLESVGVIELHAHVFVEQGRLRLFGNIGPGVCGITQIFVSVLLGVRIQKLMIFLQVIRTPLLEHGVG